MTAHLSLAYKPERGKEGKMADKGPSSPQKAKLAPLTPAERQAQADFLELDTMFNRQVLETGKAFIIGGSIGALTGLVLSWRKKKPVTIGIVSGGVSCLVYNRMKYGPWYWWAYEQWNSTHQEANRSLYPSDAFRSPAGPYNSLVDQNTPSVVVAAPVESKKAD